MKKSRYIFLYSLIFLCSCGLRVKDQTYDNLFPGRWQVSSIDCYNGGTFSEEFVMSQEGLLVEFEFKNKTFTYSVSGCGLTTNGNYVVSYESQTDGTVQIYNISSGPLCQRNMTDRRGPGETTLVSLNLLETASNSLTYRFNSNSVDLQVSTNFRGTDEATSSGGCAEVCECFFNMTQI